MSSTRSDDVNSIARLRDELMNRRKVLEEQQKMETPTQHALPQEEMFEKRRIGGRKHSDMMSFQQHEYSRLQDIMSRYKAIYNEESNRLKEALSRYLECNRNLEKALQECVECEEQLLLSKS